MLRRCWEITLSSFRVIHFNLRSTISIACDFNEVFAIERQSSRALLITANDFVSFVSTRCLRSEQAKIIGSSVIGGKRASITLFRHHFRLSRLSSHEKSYFDETSLSSLSLSLSNLSTIRCISFTSAPIFPLSFFSSRATEGCRRISPLEGVRTEGNEEKKRVPLTRCSNRRLCCFSSNLRVAVVYRTRIHHARKIINKAKGYTIRSRRNFNLSTGEYCDFWMWLTRERVTMPR